MNTKIVHTITPTVQIHD